MQHLLENHEYIKELLRLNAAHKERKAFHEASSGLLIKMGNDKDFIDLVIQRNFEDEGYLKQEWSLYNIPFFFVYENADFNLKIHLFVPLDSKKEEVAASCIHHHNNYMLSSYAMYGSGYEAFLFNKSYEFDEATKEGKFTIAKHFHQKDWPVSFVDAWEPHLVFNPAKLSATLVLWTPDKKRTTDAMRQNPILKAVKKPLRKAITWFGFSHRLGIAAQRTYQFYPENGKIKGILEDDYFEPTRKAKGPDIDTYSIQTVFRFIQEGQFLSKSYLNSKKTALPSYYQPFIEAYLSGDEIPETFAKPQINVPNGSFTKEEVLAATNG